ncbi:MAG: helix-turn-helix transcriptional regulator [Bacteroidetes bacterium]|nr:helix-turn-helix transcriptional regulator [Bacteroidota bacterium]
MKLVVPFVRSSETIAAGEVNEVIAIVNLGYTPLVFDGTTSLRVEALELYVPFYFVDPVRAPARSALLERIMEKRFPLALRIEASNLEIPTLIDVFRDQLLPVRLDNSTELSYRMLRSILENMSLPVQIALQKTRISLGMSISSLLRHCKIDLGDTPTRIIRELRLRLAHDLIYSTPETICSIAWSVGYRSHPTFTRDFKSRFGVAPSDCRDRGMTDALAAVQFCSTRLTISDKKLN